MTNGRLGGGAPGTIRASHSGDYVKLMSLGAIWGSAFMLISVALEGFEPLAVAALRVVVGALCLTAVGLALRERWPRGGKTWALICLVGFLNTALPFSLIAFGQQDIAANRAAILMTTVPFVTLLLSHFTTHDDRISGPKLFGLTLGVSGVLLVIGLDAVTEQGQPLAGQLSIMGAACCYAMSNVLTRKLSHLPPTLGTASFLLTASVYMGPCLALFWWPAEPPGDWQPYAAVLALGMAPTALAYVLRFQLIRDVGSTFLSQVGYLVPVFGVFWAWMVLSEVPSLSAVGALVLILVGIRVTQWRRNGA